MVVQNPDTAHYDGMPRSAIMTGLVDYVLDVEDIPAALIDYLRQSVRFERLAEPLLGDSDDKLVRILTLLQVRTGHDFRHYKRNTLVRRLHRRMTVNHLPGIEDYLLHVQKHPEELEALDKDLLISVTSFFREPEMWNTLEEKVIQSLVERCTEHEPLRIWVPGCATGEEAYSLAMLVDELVERGKLECPVQIYATDIDKEALEAGRRGLYPENVVEQISSERLSRFFSRDPSGMYLVNKRLREMVVFAPQNLISDPPFSKIDLITCRNVLIYIQPELQRKIITLFHFALRDGGYLVLGNSESVGQRADLFEPVSKRWRIYRQRSSISRIPLDLPLSVGSGRRAGDIIHKHAVPRSVRYADITKAQLIQRFAPPSVLVGANFETLFFSGVTRDLLSHPQGAHTDNIVEMAEPWLRPKLRTALQKAATERREVTLGGIRQSGGGDHALRLTVAPVAERHEEAGLFLVSFEYEPAEVPPPRPSPEELSEESVIHSLEEELRQSREELQSTIEEMETSNEELKASNEEVMSMNEELQSSNEELEASREELQSLNEELSTVNSELQDKVHELELITDDLDNLLTSSHIATIFVSTDFRIKRYTPSATQLLNLIPGDVGRPLRDITRKFTDDALFEDAKQVLRELTPSHREVPGDEGTWFVRRIYPYRTQDNRIEGVVITFSDVTELKAAQQRIEQYAAIVQSAQEAIYGTDLNGIVTSWNPSAERIYGYSTEEMIGQPVMPIVPDDRKPEFNEVLGRLAQGEAVERMETVRRRKDGERVDVSLTISPHRDAGGAILGASVIARDITAQKRAETKNAALDRRLRRRVAELQAIFDTAPIGIAVAADPMCQAITLNAAGAAILRVEPGCPLTVDAADGVGEPSGPLCESEGRALEAPLMQRAAEENKDIRDVVIERKLPDGERRMLSVNASPLHDEEKQVCGVVATLTDVTEREQAEQEIKRLNDFLTARNTELAATNQELETFVYSVSHDLRTPLRSINGFVQFLSEDCAGQLDAQGREYLDRVRSGTVKLGLILDDLLKLARLSRSKVERTTLDLSGLAGSIVASLREHDPERVVDVSIAHGLNAAADATLTELALSNLLGNAWKFTAKKREPHIEFGAFEHDGVTVYYVRDNGCGFDNEYKDKMFKPFHRLHSDNEFAGTGVGLAIVERIIRLHGGRTWAEGAVGEGATIYFTIG